MTVTISDIVNVVSRSFNVHLRVEDGNLSLKLDKKFGEAYIVIKMFTFSEVDLQGTTKQGAHIFLYFAHPVIDSDTDLGKNFVYTDILKIAQKFQECLTWGRLLVYDDDDMVDIVLQRSVDLCRADIQEQKSNFLQDLNRLLYEHAMLDPILAAIANNEIQTLDGIELLLLETESEH